MDVLFSLIWTLVLLILIVLACTLFTNGVEWVGYRFQLSKGAVGSVLAAVGTALPETLVPIIAILAGIFPSSHGHVPVKIAHEIAIGAILGAPFLLSTLAMFVSAVAWIYFFKTKKRKTYLSLDERLFHRDLHYFFAAFIPVFIAGFINNFIFRLILAGALLVFYAVYVFRTVTKEHIEDEEMDLEPLLFCPRSDNPPTSLILAQTAAGLIAISILAHLFVEQITHLSGIFHIDALVLSLIIAPIATELPEKFNSVVWIGKEKDSLALGNITGAMVFQSCVPTAVGLVFTEWQFTRQAVLSLSLCLLSSLTIYYFAHPKRQSTIMALLLGGGFYAVFLIYTYLLIRYQI